tara:strand:- start:203 stop:463 length:261 start_codon:yes stop_codon:yes gene_type:complete
LSSSFLEIVELSDGKIVLQQADDPDGEPMVTINFSDESRAYMMDACMDVAKVMIQAGIQAAVQISDQYEIDDESPSEPKSADRIIH